MDLDTYIERVRTELFTVAEIGGDHAVTLARQLAGPLDSALRIALLEALSDAAAEISADIAPSRVEARLQGGSVVFTSQLARDAEHDTIAAPPPSPAAPPEDTEVARISLRLGNGLKRRMETTADEAGVSTNTWIVRAITEALDGRRTASGTTTRVSGSRRVTGWVH